MVLRSTIDLARLIYLRFEDDRCIQVAGSLTFTTLLALVPLITVALTLLSAFPIFTDLSVKLKIFILMNMTPVSAGKIITVYMQQFADNAASLTTLGLIFLAVTAVLQLQTIDHAFNTLWRVRRPRPVLRRVLIYGTILTIGPFLIGASLWLSTWLVSVSLGWVQQEPTVGIALLKVTPVILTSLAFALLYFTVPNRKISTLDALIGGVVAALMFEGMKHGFAWYLAHVSTYELVYGTFASIPIFLMWLYLSWLVVVFGAVIVAVLPSWRGGGWQMQRTTGKKFFDALRILKLLYDARQTGEAMNFKQLSSIVKLKPEDIEDIIERSCSAGWVSKIEHSDWVMSGDAEKIKIADVYRLFIFLPEPGKQAPGLDAQLSELSARLHEQMQTPLKEFFTTVPEGNEAVVSASGA